MSEVNVLIPAWNNDMAKALTTLYDEFGSDGVFAYVKEFRPLWDWSYCEPCNIETPVWNSDNSKVCAVCFTYYEEIF